MKDDITTIREFNKSYEAEIARGILESAGVQSVLENGLSNLYLNGGIGLFRPYIPIRLMVKSEDAVKADELLRADFDRSELQEEVQTL